MIINERILCRRCSGYKYACICMQGRRRCDRRRGRPCGGVYVSPMGMFVCLCVCTFQSVLAYVQIYVHVQMHICVYVHLCASWCECGGGVCVCHVHISAFTRTCLHVSLYMQVCMCLCMCVNDGSDQDNRGANENPVAPAPAQSLVFLPQKNSPSCACAVGAAFLDCSFSPLHSPQFVFIKGGKCTDREMHKQSSFYESEAKSFSLNCEFRRKLRYFPQTFSREIRNEKGLFPLLRFLSVGVRSWLFCFPDHRH